MVFSCCHYSLSNFTWMLYMTRVFIVRFIKMVFKIFFGVKKQNKNKIHTVRLKFGVYYLTRNLVNVNWYIKNFPWTNARRCEVMQRNTGRPWFETEYSIIIPIKYNIPRWNGMEVTLSVSLIRYTISASIRSTAITSA